MPDDEIARAAGDGDRREFVENLVAARIGARRQPFEPAGEAAMKAGDAGEGALVRRRVREIENTLDPERHWLRDADVPMQTWSGELPAGVLRRIEATLVD